MSSLDMFLPLPLKEKEPNRNKEHVEDRGECIIPLSDGMEIISNDIIISYDSKKESEITDAVFIFL